MIKKDRRTNTDKFYKLETKRSKQSKKSKEFVVDDAGPIIDTQMSATELAEMYEDID